jgi:predicted P-loop ATPase
VTGPTAKEFLRALLKPAKADAVAWCAVMRRSQGDWTGAPCEPGSPPATKDCNAYYSIAAFPADATSRSKDQAHGACVVLLDDVTTKGDYEGVLERLGEPSFKIQTSRRSQQWGYLLDALATDEQIAPVHTRLQKLGLCDRNGNSLVRYGRLPCGVNNKPEHGSPYPVRCTAWNPERRFTLREIEEALGVKRLVVLDRDHDRESDDELEERVRTGESFHGPMTQLTCRAVMKGERPKEAIRRLRALMLDSEEQGSDRWQKTFDDIPRMIDSALRKFPTAAVRSRLRREGKGVIADEENLRLIFENDPALQGLVRYDELGMRRVLARPVPGDAAVVADDEYPRQWRDEDAVALQQYVQRNYIPAVSREKVDGALGAWARALWRFHPIRDYLKKLEWDKKPRLDDWLTTYLQAKGAPDEYLRAVGPKWLISAVARIMEPGCQADYALVLEGGQGRKKSSALRALAGDEFFSDSLPADLSSKDAADHIRGKWIIELPELAQFRKSEIETVKSFVTRRIERFRPAYGRNEIEYPRQCVFAGTTNEDQYLVDDTGNRRFWPVRCHGVNLVRLKRERDQLWAEAMARYERGERWHLDTKLEMLAAKQAEGRRLRDPWQEELAVMLTGGSLKDVDELLPGQALRELGVGAEKLTQFNAGRVGKILKALGWRKKTPTARVYVRPKE